jgi:hypothetical protein
MLRANRIRLPLYNNFLKNRQVFDATKVRFCSGSIQKSLVEYMPTVVAVGSGVGTCIGSYHGYQESKKQTYGECIFVTVCFGWLGGSLGFVLTQFYPITFPIVLVVTIVRQLEPVIKPEKKESEIYTLYDKKPN